jgi:Flp pilus assembly protein CpaB
MFRRRLPRSSVALIALAGALAAGAYLLMQSYASRLQALRPALGEPVSAVVALRDLSRGEVVGSEAIAISEVPAQMAPPGLLSDVPDAIGRVVVGPVREGEIITQARLAAPPAGPISSLVPSGLRAIAVPSDLTSDLLEAGDRVDVLVTYGGRAHTETVASGLEVLKVLGPAQSGLPGASGTAQASIVLLVAPEVAEQIAFARAFGQLSFTIVGSEEVVPVPTPFSS